MRFFLLTIFVAMDFFAFAQQKKIDSLITVNEKYKKEDSLKVIYLSNIFRQYSRQNNFEKVQEYSQKAIAIAQKLPQHFSQTYVYERLGLCYHGKSMYLQAIDAYTKGIEVGIKAKDKDIVAGFYLNLGAVYTSISDYTKALEANQLAVNLYHELNDQDQVGNCYMNIGIIYKNINQSQKAIEYIQKALVIFKKQDAGINYGVALAYQQMGNIYADKLNVAFEKFDITQSESGALALQSLQKALAIVEALGVTDGSNSSITINIGNLYEKLGDKKSALFNYEKAFNEIEQSKNPTNLAVINLTLGKFYSKNNQFEKSIGFLKKSIEISKQIGLLGVQQNSYESLSYVYEKSGKYDAAFEFYKKYIVLKDSIFNNEKEKEITRKRLQLDFSVKENDYKLLQQIIAAKLQQQSLLAIQQQQELQLKQQELQLINKEKDLQKLTYLKRQVELQNGKQIQTVLLQRKSLEAKYDHDVNGKQIATQKQQINEDKKIEMFLLLAIGLALSIAGLIFYSQRKTTQLNSIISNQKNELQQLGNMKDKIFSVVSHDMRAPINSLMSFIDILKEGNISQEKLVLYAEQLKQNLSYTSALMNNLLNWAASQMQGFKPVKESFDLSILTKEIIITLRHHLTQKNIFVINDVEINTIINADRNMMGVILRNLLSNAVKYSYKQSSISVSFKPFATLNTITITDQGVGMLPEEIVYFNNNKSNQPTESKPGTLNEKGTGLGLLLCKTFAEQMGGGLAATKNEKGMRFVFSLPQ